ncbi:Activated Cdc42 kinase Ack [Paramyrothecium foliicola]|nr:Activated Cdc42 kinase Ack [Paramyrothecium foliicola]
MAQPEPASAQQPPPPPVSPPTKSSFFRKLFSRGNDQAHATLSEPQRDQGTDVVDYATKSGSSNRPSRRVVAYLPRAQTFKRQQSEQRVHLAPVEPNPQERRTVSVDRRSRDPRRRTASRIHGGNPRVSAPGFINTTHQDNAVHNGALRSTDGIEELQEVEGETSIDHLSTTEGDEIIDEYPPQDADARSITTSQYEALLHDELECTWILNLSMHFRDKSKREKFFVTYRESEHVWRRVTVSLDYRNAAPNSLEMDLVHTEFQREKSAKIYEAIRESLPEIQFYDTVTNLKLQTTDGRLHVHVVEDGNEIISYPPVNQISYLGCRRIRERDINFEAHMSGFVYRVNVDGMVLIKKEIPSPETIDEFLYEVNALHSLRFSDHVVRFYGVVVDDDDERVKGLLISYAEQGALVDIIYDNCKEGGHGIPWAIRERWARQIVQGLADIHESGFVQGDFTLSNIVIDAAGNAKIIDINRRGCPVGWEPPEAASLIESNQRIAMYIGVKSDLFQLGMVLWGLAMEEDEPDLQGRPLILGPEVGVPDWFRQMTEICLSYDPRMRLQASSLIQRFPPIAEGKAKHDSKLEHAAISVDDGYTLRNYLVEEYHADGHPHIKTVEPPGEWPYLHRRYASPSPYQPYYHTRGRSPPSPLPSNIGGQEDRDYRGRTTWAANINIAPSYSDVGVDELPPYGISQQPTPTPTVDQMAPSVSDISDKEPPMGPHDTDDVTGTSGTEALDIETPRVEADTQVAEDIKLESGGAGLNDPTTDGSEQIQPPVQEANCLQPHDGSPDLTWKEADASTEYMQGGPDLAAVTQFIADAKKQDIEVEGIVEEASGLYISGNTELEEGRGDLSKDSSETATAADEAPSPGKGVPGSSTIGTHEDSPTEHIQGTSIPRTVDIPDTLKGVGAGHAPIDEDFTHATDIYNGEFTVETKANTASTLPNTTETNT